MIDRHRPTDEHAAAYQAGEPRRSRDPFAAPAVQVALAGEAERRARRPRDGWLAWLLRSVENAPRAGLVGAALSLAVVAASLPSEGVIRLADESEFQSPMSVASEPGLGAAEPAEPAATLDADEKSAELPAAAVPADEPTHLPITAIAGIAGLLASLLVIERTRRRRRA
jgi:hypothetical protein